MTVKELRERVEAVPALMDDYPVMLQLATNKGQDLFELDIWGCMLATGLDGTERKTIVFGSKLPAGINIWLGRIF